MQYGVMQYALACDVMCLSLLAMCRCVLAWACALTFEPRSRLVSDALLTQPSRACSPPQVSRALEVESEVLASLESDRSAANVTIQPSAGRPGASSPLPPPLPPPGARSPLVQFMGSPGEGPPALTAETSRQSWDLALPDPRVNGGSLRSLMHPATNGLRPGKHMNVVCMC